MTGAISSRTSRPASGGSDSPSRTRSIGDWRPGMATSRKPVVASPPPSPDDPGGRRPSAPGPLNLRPLADGIIRSYVAKPNPLHSVGLEDLGHTPGPACRFRITTSNNVQYRRTPHEPVDCRK